MAADMLWDDDPCIFIFKEEIAGKMKMHVKNLDLKDWVRIDKTYCEQMQAKKPLYETNLDDIFVTRNDDHSTTECKREFYELLIQHLLERYPDKFEIVDDGHFIRNKITQELISTTFESDDEDPLLRAGRLTQDDWIILQFDPNQSMYVLAAGILCFPSSWDLTEKFNKPLTDIHQPVKPYLKYLKDKVNNLFERMKPEHPLWRANWGLYNHLKDTADLFLHPRRQLHAVGGEEDIKLPFEGHLTGRKLFLRCEYQTIRKLPKTKCIVFGIRKYQRHLEELKQHPVEDAKSLLHSIETSDDEYLAYKGGDMWKEAAVKYLKLIIDKSREETEKQFSTFNNSPFCFYKSTPFILGIVLCVVVAVHKIKTF